MATGTADADAPRAAELGADPRDARRVTASASRTVAWRGLSGSRTSSITAIGALSPFRFPIFVIRV